MFVDVDSGSQLRGREQIRSGLQALFQIRPRLEGQQLLVFQAGDLALVLSRWIMTRSRPDGETFDVSGVATDVMRRQPDGTWRYVVDNPVGVAHLRT